MIDPEFSKLYGLYVIENEHSRKRELSFSHSIKKLKKSVFLPENTKAWFVQDPALNVCGTISQTEGSIFPFYQINEVNFII